MLVDIPVKMFKYRANKMEIRIREGVNEVAESVVLGIKICVAYGTCQTTASGKDD